MPCHPCPVLVIDDDELLAELLAAILADGGYEVLIANDGAEGLRLARTAAPALVLCDMSMPRLSGAEVFRRFKEDPDTSAMPFVLMSGDVAPKLDGPQPDSFLPKPFSPGTVLQLVETLVERTKLAA